jgi:hypothetical protein
LAQARSANQFEYSRCHSAGSKDQALLKGSIAMRKVIISALSAAALAILTVPPGVAYADPYDDAAYGQLAADAHANGIPGGTTQIGTIAEGTCALTSGSMTRSDMEGTLRDTAPAAWSLLRSWTQPQKQAFAVLVIKDGICGSSVTTQSPLAP